VLEKTVSLAAPDLRRVQTGFSVIGCLDRSAEGNLLKCDFPGAKISQNLQCRVEGGLDEEMGEDF